MRRGLATIGAVAAIVLAGCASATPEESDSPVESDPAEDSDTAEEDDPAEEDETSEDSEPTDSDDPADADEDAAPEASADYLDELYAESLHEGVAPADPGTAYIEVAGERFEFESLSCTIHDEPDIGQFIVSASGETTDSGHTMYLSRQIGTEIGFNFEDEHVQLSLLTIEDGEGRMSNSMAQHERAQGEPAEWVRGSGTHPLVRVVGDEATASGMLAGVPFAPNPAEAEFVAAATCP